jgi:glycosyltransferase involved in cell wall biosynthesis
MSRPFFSVIVPAYNAAGFIRKGLDSIRAQSFTDYELIVVCDKCLDNTAEIAREYTDRVVEIDHDVDGRGHNVGLRMAAGRWVLWMDHDDWWLHEYAFQTIAEVLAEYGEDTDVLAFGFIMKGVGIAINCPPKIYPALWNKCWRREFLGDTELPAWDMEIAMMLHPKARFRFFPMPLYYYNFMAPGSLSEKLMKGEVDTAEIPEGVRGVFEGYKNALNDGSIHV